MEAYQPEILQHALTIALSLAGLITCYTVVRIITTKSCDEVLRGFVIGAVLVLGTISVVFIVFGVLGLVDILTLPTPVTPALLHPLQPVLS